MWMKGLVDDGMDGWMMNEDMMNEIRMRCGENDEQFRIFCIKRLLMRDDAVINGWMVTGIIFLLSSNGLWPFIRFVLLYSCSLSNSHPVVIHMCVLELMAPPQELSLSQPDGGSRGGGVVKTSGEKCICKVEGLKYVWINGWIDGFLPVSNLLCFSSWQPEWQMSPVWLHLQSLFPSKSKSRHSRFSTADIFSP